MLTAEERRARYHTQAQAGDTWTETGPQRRRIRHKERHADPSDRGHARRAGILAVRARLAAHRAWIRSLGR
jgi:hypothetical protein